jgi:hypothetical protein
VVATVVRGIPETIKQLHLVDPELTRAEIDDIYGAAKAAAAALRSSVPRIPLSNMEDGGAVRASVTRGSVSPDMRYGINSRRLATVRLTGPKFAVISDMARVSHGSTMVANLTGKYGGASRWVWPTVERYIPQFAAMIELAIKRTEVKVNLALRKRI